jgi:pimeloyl-ACP methyl ester carboxylesterase
MVFQERDGIGFAAGRWPLDQDRPTLVFIHGSGGSHALWQGQVDAMLAVANTIAVDLPGHGASRGPGCDRVSHYADAVAGLMEDLQMPRPVPCGLSIGGAIVLQLLLDRPALLAGGVLIGTGARLRVLPDIIEAVETDYAHFIDMLGQFGASEKTDPARLTPIMHATASCAPAVTAGDFRACDRFDVMDRLDRIDTPVLVLCGSDDRLTPPKYSAYLEHHIRGSRQVTIPDAGHLVPIEQPVAVNRELTAFIAQL